MINNNSSLAAEFWEQGFVKDCPIIDFHAHMGLYSSAYFTDNSAKQQLKQMDRCNIQLLLFAGHEAFLMPSSEHQADIAAVVSYPNRLKSYFAINGNSPNLKKDYERFINNPDIFVGLKYLPDYVKIPLTADCYKPFFEYIDHHKMLFLCHTWDSLMNGPKNIEEFIKLYPNIKIIAGHSFHGDWEGAVRLCNSHDNLFLELTAVPDERGAVEFLLEKCGSERLLFGSDMPWFHTHYYIGALLSIDMTDDDRRNIFYKNGEKLLNHYDWFKNIQQNYKDKENR